MSRLKDTLRRFARTRPVQFFARHAGIFMGLYFGVGNIGWIVKDYLQSHPRRPVEQVVGALFLVMSGCVFASKRRPDMRIPAGIAGTLGCIALVCAARGLEGERAQIVAACASGTLTLGMIFEERANAFAARKAKDSKIPALRKIFGAYAKYPVAIGSCIDMTLSALPLACAAVARRDWGMLALTPFWIAGGFSAIAHDKNMNAKILSLAPVRP